MKKQKNKSRQTIFNPVKTRQRQETLFLIKQTKRQERFMVRKKKAMRTNKQNNNTNRIVCNQLKK